MPDDARRCTARSKQTGQRCGAWKKPGHNVCQWHGANTPQARRKAQERHVVEQARKLIPDLTDLAPITDPLGKLLELASEADGFRESLRRLANDVERMRYESNAGGEQLRAEVATYRAAMNDVTSMLVAIAKLDIDARLARIQERQLDAVMAALTAGMTEAHLPDETKRTVMTGVGRHLRLAAG